MSSWERGWEDHRFGVLVPRHNSSLPKGPLGFPELILTFIYSMLSSNHSSRPRVTGSTAGARLVELDGIEFLQLTLCTMFASYWPGGVGFLFRYYKHVDQIISFNKGHDDSEMTIQTLCEL